MNADSPATETRLTLYAARHARRQRGRALSHLAPAVVLISGSVAVFSGAEPLSGLRIIEFVVGAAYLLLLVRELRHLRRHPHHHERVAWLELAAAGILALEGYHIWHRHHEAELLSGQHRTHVLPWLYAGLSLFYVGQAFGVRHVLERRFLHLHAGGFRGRTRLLEPAFDYQWSDVAAVEPAEVADLVVVHHDGRRERISFAKLHDGPAQRDRLLAHAQANLAPLATPLDQAAH